MNIENFYKQFVSGLTLGVKIKFIKKQHCETFYRADRVDFIKFRFCFCLPLEVFLVTLSYDEEIIFK